MKSFWASILLFAVMLTAIVANYNYVDNITNNLYTLVYNIPSKSSPDCYIQTCNAHEYWKNKCHLIWVSVNADSINTLSSEISKLKYLAKEGTTTDFELAQQQLLEFITKFRQHESISLHNIV